MSHHMRDNRVNQKSRFRNNDSDEDADSEDMDDEVDNHRSGHGHSNRDMHDMTSAWSTHNQGDG